MLNEQRLMQTFLDLVQIDSPSGDESAIAEYVAARLRKLGAEARVDALYNVIAKLEGNGVKKSIRPLLLNAHTDNVAPAHGIHPIIAEGRISSDGSTVLGADDLAGVAAILEGVQAIVEDNKKRLPLELAITSQEEMGLVGAKGIELSEFSARKALSWIAVVPLVQLL